MTAAWRAVEPFWRGIFKETLYRMSSWFQYLTLWNRTYKNKGWFEKTVLQEKTKHHTSLPILPWEGPVKGKTWGVPQWHDCVLWKLPWIMQLTRPERKHEKLAFQTPIQYIKSLDQTTQRNVIKWGAKGWHTFLSASRSAPRRSKTFTTSLCPIWAAIHKGAVPSWRVRLGKVDRRNWRRWKKEERKREREKGVEGKKEKYGWNESERCTKRDAEKGAEKKKTKGVIH